MDTATMRYNGKLIFFVFLAISIMTMAFALSSGIMKVNFLISLLQMAELCAFSYLQFWTHDRAISERP
jgi:hypothetical protein